MLKIKDNVDLKELEKYGYIKHQKKEAKVDYYKFIKGTKVIVRIMKDKTISLQLPISMSIGVKYLKIDNYIDDLTKANLVEKVEEE